MNTPSELLPGLARTRHHVGIAADHGGYAVKEYLVAMLEKASHEVVGFGDRRQNLDDDYPDFVVPLSCAVANGEIERSVAMATIMQPLLRDLDEVL